MKGQKKQDESNSRQLVSLAQLSREWSCSRSTVRRILAEAGVQPFFLSDHRNGTVRYNRAEVDTFLARCRAGEAPLKDKK